VDKRTHFSLWYVIFAFLVMFFIQGILYGPNVETVPYSDFIKYVKQGKIKEVLISDKLITATPTEAFVKGLEESGKIPKWKMKKHQIITSVRVHDPQLVSFLLSHNVRFAAKLENKWLSEFFFSWVLPLILLFGIWSVLFKKMGQGGPGLLSIGKSKAKIYEEKETGITFEDVAGQDEAKEELKEIIEFLKYPARYQNIGGRLPKGILLVGPPGTGKTLLAKAVAGEAHVPFLSISGSDFVEMFVGVGAARVRDLFNEAEKRAPCIIFIDEIDALGKARGIGGLAGNDEREQTLNQLLAEMDGFDARKGVIILAATNRPEILDAALLRAGRFDRQILVDRPDILEREAILKVHAKNVKMADDVDLKVIAKRTPGFVGADLANLINEAALLAVRKGREKVTMEEMEEAIDRIVAGLEKKKRVMNKKEKEIVAVHETGHALVAESVPNADPVHRISIIPRGIGALGYTLQLPTEDRYLMTKEELLDKVTVLLGGRGAEELTFQEISTGAQNDLERATDIARRMVMSYGMSEKLGLVTFEKSTHPAFLGGNYPIPGQGGGKEYSEKTAYIIDEEVKEIIQSSYERVKRILTSHRDDLRKVPQMLMEKEVLEGDEFRKMIGKDIPSSEKKKEEKGET
jgi:cell division protease FtsH